MRLKQLLGLPVVDARVARQAGIVADLLVDPVAARVAALSVEHGDGWLVQRVPASFVQRVTPQAVLVRDSAELEYGAPILDDPGWLRAHIVLGLEALTERGDRLGHVVDARVDPSTLGISAFLLAPPRWWPWRRGPRQVLPGEVLCCSPELMLVRAGATLAEGSRVQEGHPALPAER